MQNEIKTSPKQELMPKIIIQNEIFVFRVFKYTNSGALECLFSLCSTNRTPRTLLADYVRSKWSMDQNCCVIFGKQSHNAFLSFAVECSVSELPVKIGLAENERLVVDDDTNLIILGGSKEIKLEKNKVFSKAVQSLYDRICLCHENHGFKVGRLIQGPKLRSFLTLLLDNSEQEITSITFPNLGSPEISSLSSTFCADDNVEWCLLKDKSILSNLSALLREQVITLLKEKGEDLRGYKIYLLTPSWYIGDCMNYLSQLSTL